MMPVQPALGERTMTTSAPVDPDVHLLVVDDDMLLRSMAVKALRHTGFTVSDASSGEEALDKYARHTYDLDLTRFHGHI